MAKKKKKTNKTKMARRWNNADKCTYVSMPVSGNQARCALHNMVIMARTFLLVRAEVSLAYGGHLSHLAIALGEDLWFPVRAGALASHCQGTLQPIAYAVQAHR